ncbi:MAG: hypothetical protein C0523_03655 [Cytophaga sp.]|nr:hypothetical protein [Cytophaga sp.]
MKALSIVLFLSPLVMWAQNQTPPTHQKKAFLDSAGTYYQQASLPVYIYVASSADGQPVPLKSETGGEIKLEGHGVHAFRHLNYTTKGYDFFQIHADGIAPVTTIKLTGAPSFGSVEKFFYGPGLSASLSATDEMSGLEGIFHSMNGKEFEKYQPFVLSKEGKYKYSYYALDRTGNAEAINTRSFTVDLTPPSTYHNIVSISSQNVISTNSTIYLTIADSLSGVAKTFFRFDKENVKPYTGGNIPFQYLPDGDHTLTYFSVDNVTNKETEKVAKFYLDKTAPIMSADVLGDKFIVGDKVYFSGRTKLKLTAVDNKSGIKDMMYSINEDPFGKYEEPFYLPGRSGIHNVKYYAIDNTNNKVRDDFEHSVGLIYVDLTGPSLTHGFSGPSFVKADTVLVSPKTKIILSGNDPEAGLKKIAYLLDDNTNELTYSGKPIDITVTGLHTLHYFGYDNVNNKNEKATLFYVDAEGPEINAQFAVAPSKEGKLPSYTSVFLSATDNEVGAGEIKYSINGGKELLYVAPIKGFAKNKDYTIRVKATDLLGNESSKEIKFRTDRY